MKNVLVPAVIAAVSVGGFNLVFGLFSHADAFWIVFPAVISGIVLLILLLERRFGVPAEFSVSAEFSLKKVAGNIFSGAVSAGLLYLVFFLGQIILSLIFESTPHHVGAVYRLRDGESLWRIALLLALIIGPGEELLWRGFLQRRLCTFMGPWKGLFFTTFFYATAHLASGNPVLILAALVCGLWWGGQYLVFRSLSANIVSHALWDLLVFVWFPL